MFSFNDFALSISARHSSNCIVCGVILFELWSNWNSFPTRTHLRRWLYSKTEKHDVRLENRLAELRIERVCKLSRVVKNGMVFPICILSVGPACLVELSLLPESFFFGFGFRLLLAYVGLSMSAQGHINTIPIGLLLGSCMSLCESYEEIIITGPTRCLLRAFFGTVYMDWRMTCLMNAIHLLATSWVYSAGSNTDTVVRHCAHAAFIWLCTTAFCFATETWWRESLRIELSASASRRAAERLLSGFCDAVVRLGPDLCLEDVSPQYMHLMSPTSVVDRHAFEGTLFTSHLANESERKRFEALISNALIDTGATMCGPPPALRVNLKHGLGREVNVELFHVIFAASEQGVEHVIGIRELRREGSEPDESLFQGRKTSLVLQPRTENENEAALVLAPRIESEGSMRPTCQGGRPPAPARSLESASSSKDSSSSCSNVPSFMRRYFPDLDSIQMRFDGNLNLEAYILRFDQKDQNRPNVKTCLIGDGVDPFIAWLKHSANVMTNDISQTRIRYEEEVLFRHPNAACASSKVRLCAESVYLSSVEEDDESHTGFIIEVQLYGIAQVIGLAPGSHPVHSGMNPRLMDRLQPNAGSRSQLTHRRRHGSQHASD